MLHFMNLRPEIMPVKRGRICSSSGPPPTSWKCSCIPAARNGTRDIRRLSLKLSFARLLFASEAGFSALPVKTGGASDVYLSISTLSPSSMSSDCFLVPAGISLFLLEISGLAVLESSIFKADSFANVLEVMS